MDKFPSLKGHFKAPMDAFLYGHQTLPSEQKKAAPDYDQTVRELLAKSISKSPFKRSEIAERMGTLNGVKMTKQHIDSFTGESRRAWALRIAQLPAFIKATEDSELFPQLAKDCGYVALPKDLAFLIDLGHAEAVRQNAVKTKAGIKKSITAHQLRKLEKLS